VKSPATGGIQTELLFSATYSLGWAGTGCWQTLLTAQEINLKARTIHPAYLCATVHVLPGLRLRTSTAGKGSKYVL